MSSTNGSPRSAEWYRNTYRDASVSYTVVAATDYTTATAKITVLTGHTIFIQKIAFNVTTDNAATQLFQDDATTPVIATGVKASPGIGPLLYDFGAKGFALTEGKSFMHKMSGAGIAGTVVVEAYQRQTVAAGVPSTTINRYI